MKYFIIVGEASGDLHASHLMAALKEVDKEADFRYFGGDLMAAEGGKLLKHYKEIAYMGFVPVLLNLRTIFANMKRCKEEIVAYQPNVVILVDYPGFNLSIAKFVKSQTGIPVFYYISPKIWAWKEYRIKNIKRDVDEMYCILPFEVDFYRKHNYSVHYVGNPTVDEVVLFKANCRETFQEFSTRHALSDKPVIALLAGSRRQEIKDNLPDMLKAASQFKDHQLVLAGAPGIEPDYYQKFTGKYPVTVIYGETYPLLSHARAALVTSGTATLETALFDVPQVVCYHTPIGKVIAFLKKHVLSVKYISLVNLIKDKEVVKELVADTMTVENMQKELSRLLEDPAYRRHMLEDYQEIHNRLGTPGAPRKAAGSIYHQLLNSPN
ncbi:MAG: lipid-A-disaccharide synthase [Bacteroides sp.]|nr:lipid-A-disaccharide synthase [Bacteroides sp.]